MTTIIGLTGGIGAGKSQASALFLSQNIPVIDVDQISRQITAPHAIGSVAVGNVFGSEFIDQTGAMDRAKMRQLVFNDLDAKQKLESVLHPLISDEIQKQINELTAQNHPFIILDCPLLAQSQRWRELVHQILVIDADTDTRLKRIVQRPGIDEAMAKRIMASQASRNTLLQLADYVIVNNDSIQAFENALIDFVDTLQR